MAVKIDIPGVGEVVADNAASEDTLLEILAVLDESTSKGKKRTKDEEEALKVRRENTKQLREGTKTTKDFNTGWKAAVDGYFNAIKTVSLTAISMATRFATDFENIANDPIKTTASTLNQMIDATTNVTTGLTDAIPVIGKLISAFVEAGAEIAKAANNTFADQLQKNIDALQKYASVGASFTGGMTEMQNVAQSAGMGILQFSEVVSKSRDELNKLGLVGSESTMLLSKAMGISANESKRMTKSGESFRTEMFKMGYAYEEQGELFASFMANQQAAGKLRAMTDKEIAIGTREYAKDLKVISDITGRDAKRLMDESRKDVQRGALLATLDGDAKEAFIKANSLLAKAGPDAQQALLEALTFDGKVIDPKLAAQPELVKLAVDVANQVRAGNKNITDTTTKSMSTLQKELSTTGKNFGQAVDKGLVAQVGGITGDIASSRNKLQANLGTFFDPDMANKSGAAAEAMATSQDDLSKQTSKLYEQTNEFARTMEKTINPELGRYAKLLTAVNEATLTLFKKFLDGENALEEKEKRKKDMVQYAKDAEARKVEGEKANFQRDLQRSPYESDEEYRSRVIKMQANMPKFDKGGSIPAGKVGMAGEKGPEIIAGPAEVLSTKSTEKLMQSVDMLASVKDTQTTQNNSASTAKLDEMISQLMELVRLMRDNVNHTARVAQNTN